MSAGARRQELLVTADITFTAEVRAEQLRFGEVPQTRTEFTGVPAYRSLSGSDRANLPDAVEKDITYLHVRVDYWLAAKATARSCARPRGDGTK